MSIGRHSYDKCSPSSSWKKGIIIGANILSFAILNELQLAGIKVDHIVLPEKVS